MNEIICRVNMFSSSYVEFPNGHKEILTPGLDLASCLPPICYSEGISNLHLVGDENYLTGLVEEINYLIETKFAEKEKLNIEVN